MDEHLGHSHGDHVGHSHGDHEHTITSELMYHMPYAIFSVAFGLTILSFLGYYSFSTMSDGDMQKGANLLFHSFHFMHIVFAATGTLITYFRFSKSKSFLQALVVGTVTPIFFCTLSDAILPYFGGRLLGVDMDFHLCFISELNNVLPFLFVGVFNGFVISRHHISRQTFSHEVLNLKQQGVHQATAHQAH